MEIATIKRGESFTFKVVLNAEYDMARLKEYYLYIGGRAMTGTVNGNAITVKLRSEDTDLMSGINKITLWLDDTILGVQKPYLGDMVVSMTNAYESNSSVSEVDNALIPVTITATAITVGDILYNYVVGRSAYEIWLDAGNTGTREDYFAYLQSPATAAIASIQAVESTVSGNEALRVTAENTRKENETARLSAEALRVEAETARQTNTSTAIQQTNAARDLALEVAEHPDKIVADYWWKWNTTTNAYENTNIMAKGGVYYPVFRLDPETGILSITADSDFTNTTFEIDKTRGTLILKINQ